jgi:hypothetical protein
VRACISRRPQDDLACDHAIAAAASHSTHTHAGLVSIKLVSSTGEQASGILLAAAAPVTLLTALSKSSLGKQVQEKLEQRLPQLQAEAAALRQRHAGVLAGGLCVCACVCVCVCVCARACAAGRSAACCAHTPPSGAA